MMHGIAHVREGFRVSVPKSRILIADPDVDIRQSLRLYFEANGHEVQTVGQAGNIVRTARPWQPNAILISYDFSDRDPFHICRELLDDTLIGHIPLIMLLHVNNRQARLTALEVGVSDIIIKPFDVEELQLRVEAAIRLSTMRVGV
ncbi:MAG: response regulator transcription factor [Chloroflexi bacterium]|nr:response regulator transcription factor [Chloroflexota bacterium]